MVNFFLHAICLWTAVSPFHVKIRTAEAAEADGRTGTTEDAKKAQTIPETPGCPVHCCPPRDPARGTCGYDGAAVPSLIACCENLPLKLLHLFKQVLGLPATSSKRPTHLGGTDTNASSEGETNEENSAGNQKGQQNNTGKTGASMQIEGSTPSTGTNENISSTEENSGEKSTQTDADILRNFQLSTVDEHNILRDVHEGPPLELDEELNRHAQGWANDMARRKTLEHSSTNEGENLVRACTMDGRIETPGKRMSEMWYKEVEHYDWNNPGYSAATGHFTQLVWKNSRRIGVGAAVYKDAEGRHCHVGVARYLPAGNVMGQFPENVKKGTYKGPENIPN